LPNARGMFDMNGNVSEWCLLSQIAEDDRNINKNLSDSVQVIIGGSWASEADNCNHDKRKICHVNYKSNDLGFRLAHEP
jgi:formylglycine-generating enzyme required for sulfatase activity